MKSVLSVGQCHIDHNSLERFLKSHFDVKITPVETSVDAISHLRKAPFDLVLVNRQFDLDGTEGVDFIRDLKGHADLSKIPVMLVTNFPEYMQQAVALGAEPGFGKAELRGSDLPVRLKPYLG
jgi:DNA-binding NarL/FixJ family response regulator